MNLEQVSKMNDAAVAAFDTFGTRKRFRTKTNVLRFHRELEEKYGTVNQDELISMFKRLEDEGMGSLVLSRNKQNTRFIWNYSLRDVAKAAKGELPASDLHKVSKGPVKVVRRPSIQPKAEETVSQPEPIATPSEVLIIRGSSVFSTIYVPIEKEALFNEMLKLFQK